MLVTELKIMLHPLLQLFSNAVWLFSAELLSKISRVVTIIVLAVELSAVSYGTAMLALACHDMLALMLRAGAGSQIIRCNDKDLSAFAKNGATIQWGICLTLASVQYCLAQSIANWYDNPNLVQLLQVMAVIYLFYPWVSVKIFLLQRANQMRQFSIRNGICISAENISIALFAWCNADFMAVAYGKIVFSILWLVLFSFTDVKSYGLGFDLKVIKSLLHTSGQLFSSELLRALRLHADTFIAAKIMSPELFGLYSFAKNAGIGLSQSISNVFNSALFPFLCKLQRKGTLASQQRLIYLITLAVGMLFVVQAWLVPFYVPVLFDEKWHDMIPIVSIMCLVALPSIIVDSYCSFERVKANFNREIVTRFVCLFISLSLLFIYSPEQPMDFALVILFSSLLWCAAIYFGHRLIHKAAHYLAFFSWRKSHEY
ncbi:MAG: oligosaccharide flippase family protein [Oceanospirillaceae bacterium]